MEPKVSALCLLGYYDNKKLIYAGRTGTGFTQVNSRKLRKQLEGYAANRNALRGRAGLGRQGCSLGAARVGGGGSVQYLDCRQPGAASQLQGSAGRQEGDGGAPRGAGPEPFAEGGASPEDGRPREGARARSGLVSR